MNFNFLLIFLTTISKQNKKKTKKKIQKLLSLSDIIHFFEKKSKNLFHTTPHTKLLKPVCTPRFMLHPPHHTTTPHPSHHTTPNRTSYYASRITRSIHQTPLHYTTTTAPTTSHPSPNANSNLCTTPHHIPYSP